MPSPNNDHIAPGMSEQEFRSIIGLQYDPDYEDKIYFQANGNLGAAVVLRQLYDRGTKVFDAVSPNLGSGIQVWDKYKNCRDNLDAVIAQYSS